MPADPVLLALRRHAVRLTPVRRAVLRILADSPFALSGGEIEKQLPLTSDRITLYRTLRTFEEKGLVHRVIDHSEVVRYAVSPEAASAAAAPAAAPASHVHFKCNSCQHIYCLHHVAVPALCLPGYFRTERADYLLSGVCERCQPN